MPYKGNIENIRENLHTCKYKKKTQINTGRNAGMETHVYDIIFKTQILETLTKQRYGPNRLTISQTTMIININCQLKYKYFTSQQINMAGVGPRRAHLSCANLP